MKRRIMQIAVSSPANQHHADVLYALATDGSLWMMADPVDEEEPGCWIAIDPLPDAEPEVDE